MSLLGAMPSILRMLAPSGETGSRRMKSMLTLATFTNKALSKRGGCLLVRFFKSHAASKAIDKIVALLSSHKKHFNIQDHQHFNHAAEQLADELLLLHERYRLLPPAWSDHASCTLNINQKLWLDPGRSLVDEAFKKQYMNKSWIGNVAEDAALLMGQHIEQCYPDMTVSNSVRNIWSETFERAIRESHQPLPASLPEQSS